MCLLRSSVPHDLLNGIRIPSVSGLYWLVSSCCIKNLASVIVAASALIRFFHAWSFSLPGTLSDCSSDGVTGLPDRMRWASDRIGESRACR